MVETIAVVVAAGSGARLGASVPKALVDLGGQPLVWHAVTSLLDAGVSRVVVTVPDGWQASFDEALTGLTVTTVVGGARRQDSVRIGLAALAAPSDDIVLVHDAARPLVPADVIARVRDAVAAGADAVVPAVPVVDSIREEIPHGTRTVDRTHLRAVQTPQGFRYGVLLSAHRFIEEQAREVTDDAAAAEALGQRVVLVPGDRRALKITEPHDLAVAELMLRR